jgi:hypothetical protein
VAATNLTRAGRQPISKDEQMTVTGRAEAAGRRAAHSRPLEVAARMGFLARGAIYVLIGALALQIAFAHRGRADRGGAVAQIASQSYGTFVLWLLVVGFAGMALWRLSEAVFGAAGPDGHKASERLQSLARAVMYGAFFLSILKFVTGTSSKATANGNSQSHAFTARVMSHSGGRLLVGLAGVVVIGIGIYLAYQAWTEKFRRTMDLSGTSAGVRSAVTALGRFGGVARGAVVVLAGVLLLTAAVRFQPNRAEGIDGTLRTFAHAPLGTFILVLVAIGLIAFGVFSCCEARWRRI